MLGQRAGSPSVADGSRAAQLLAGGGLPVRPLYRVRFLQREVWPDYAGRADDTIDIEIYEHWLERT